MNEKYITNRSSGPRNCAGPLNPTLGTIKPYELFEVLAGKTWRSIERFSRNRIHLGEDAITSNNLDALASAGPACVFLEDTRAQESTKGCDFELWIGSSHMGWRRYAVQAKKIQVSSSRYASLAHEVAGVPQIDILDTYARANRALAIYCFYNHATKPYKWNCNLPLEVEQLGCSVTPSSIVRAAIATHGARNFTHIHSQQETLPWRCILRCPNFVSKAARGHPGWPSLAGSFHPKLPAALLRLRAQPGQISFEDQPDLFNSEIQFRPQWVGIVDVSVQGRDRG
jgi:hypothetical protein